MAASAPRKRRARGSVDPEKILDGAFEIAANVGLDNLSMPDLAAHLDVGVTSIYWYFRSKDELLRQMSARAMSEVQSKLPSPAERDPQDWRAFMAEYTLTHRALHHDANLLTELLIIRLNTYGRRATIVGFEGVEAILGYLMRAGFGRETAWHVISTYSLYIRGFIMTEYHRRVNQTPPEGLPQLSLLAPEGMPLLSELIVHDGVIMDMSGEASLAAGLEMIGDGAEALLQRDHAPTASSHS